MYTKFLTGLTGGAIAGLIFKYFLKKANAESTPAETPTTPVNETLVLSDDGDLYKMALIINSELKMTMGKVMAQCSHAAVGIYERYLSDNAEIFEQWERKGKPITIYKVNDSETLESLQQAAKARKLMTCLIHDAGRTQIAAGSRTVLAIGPDDVEKIQKLVGFLPLF